MKCPYCDRRLRMGVKCRACRRYVLRWPHLVIVSACVAACVFALLELLA